ncbi:uncharacterized protein EI90DRAFT_3060534, partial [Cantharellus anzutake]|uniref:uncharacterized protein n=1 Tax=Cantharellus anzutake TaxID=1750568 RepID=UPI001906282F
MTRFRPDGAVTYTFGQQINPHVADETFWDPAWPNTHQRQQDHRVRPRRRNESYKSPLTQKRHFKVAFHSHLSCSLAQWRVSMAFRPFSHDSMKGNRKGEAMEPRSHIIRPMVLHTVIQCDICVNSQHFDRVLFSYALGGFRTFCNLVRFHFVANIRCSAAPYYWCSEGVGAGRVGVL